MAYAQSNKPDGVIIDLLDAAASKLGLSIKWSQIPYSGLVSALQSKRVDIAGTQISKTPENKGVVNLLAFYNASSSLLVPAGKNYASDTDACGTRLGLTTGSTVNKNIADSINTECKAAGKPALQYLYYQSFNAGEDAIEGKLPLDAALQGIRACGPGSTLLTGDLGQPHNGPIVGGIQQWAAALHGAGFTPEDIRRVLVDNPAAALGGGKGALSLA